MPLEPTKRLHKPKRQRLATGAAVLVLAHGPLLDLPFYWDELGQFIPASLDILHGGHWIPQSTLPNVHPPGLMAWLAGTWLVAGYSIESTRIAMLLLAAGGALCAFLLAVELGSTVEEIICCCCAVD